MIQQEFAMHAKTVLAKDENVIGLAVGGSWLSGELDNYSDLDLILVTQHKVSDTKEQMVAYAQQLGNYLVGFTGEHVGEPRLLICLYDNPLLHIDIKFVTLEEFEMQTETPHLLLDKNGKLQEVLNHIENRFPEPDHQWIEDRFWVWIHYSLLKIGRGEYMEAIDSITSIRRMVLAPLLHQKNGNKLYGVRRVETALPAPDLKTLQQTIPTYDKQSLLTSLHHSINLYLTLREQLYSDDITLQTKTQHCVLDYFNDIKEER